MEEEESWGAPNLWEGLTAAQTAEWLAVVRQILELDGITPRSLGGSPPSPRDGGKAKDQYEPCPVQFCPAYSPHRDRTARSSMMILLPSHAICVMSLQSSMSHNTSFASAMINSANQARGREFWRTRKLTAYSGRLAQADDIQHLPLAAATSTLWYSSDIIKSRMYPRATPTHRFICSLER